MADKAQTTLQHYEPILSARYTSGWSWAAGAFAASIVYAAVWGLYTYPLRGDYFRTVCAIIALPAYVLISLDILLTKEIVFYRDRVEKVWHLVGRRTIPYSTGLVRGPADEFRWIQKGYTIREVGADGKAALVQVPIGYNARFVDSETAKQIDVIMAYMAGDKLNKPTRFTKATLPKEVVCSLKTT